ncbi:MAG: HPP family protein [Clostridiales bacterium]|nr:HPP family protein [Clostridiales bacterium]MBS5878368.1 HPP family protein [Clostridiales bacterium]MDU0939848.1 HPP family protein [Clostridiales bacterium]MDU1042692.1 HPP family protein [Clostridiales bacterium]MDU3489531.1 HPP family protein [Clostridiales bacterium]
MKLKLFKKVSYKEVIMTSVGSICGIGGISLLAFLTGYPFIIAPFGASAVLLYSATASPLAQPRNFCFSHLITATIAITCNLLLGPTWYTMAVAVTISIIVMMLTDTLHPPGGATALLCVMQNVRSYFFLLAPLTVGIAIMLTSAILSTKIFPGVRPYPFKPFKERL